MSCKYCSNMVFKNFNNNTKQNKYKRKRKRIDVSVKPIIKCGTVILNEDKTKIMLVQNNYLKKEQNVELWSIPKGSRINNETYADCAIRETYEETGITLPLKNSMLRIKIKNTFYFIYIMKIMTNILIPVDKTEIYKVKWVELDNINFNKLNLETKLFIKRKMNILKNI